LHPSVSHYTLDRTTTREALPWALHQNAHNESRYDNNTHRSPTANEITLMLPRWPKHAIRALVRLRSENEGRCPQKTLVGLVPNWQPLHGSLIELRWRAAMHSIAQRPPRKRIRVVAMRGRSMSWLSLGHGDWLQESKAPAIVAPATVVPASA